MTNVRSKTKGITIRDLLMYVLIQFPISSILKVYIGPLNILLTTLVFTLLFFYYLKCGLRKYEVVLILYAIITVIVNCVETVSSFV